MSFESAAFEGILHRFAPRLVAFEHSDEPNPNTDTLIWIGGLGDGLLTVSYPSILSQHLPPNWTLTQIVLSSSYSGWGTSSVIRDAWEIAQCVQYFQSLRPGRKVVLMGHSTGCQDIMEYVVGEENADRPRVQGAILQAPVSDREVLIQELPEGVYETSVKLAEEWVEQGRGEDVLPESATRGFFGGPVSARRWLSLASPNKDGDDDYFSSDLEIDELRKTFGLFPKECPLLILYSGHDQHVPDFVDKAALVQKWMQVAKEGGGVVDEQFGGIIERAHHSLEKDPDEVVSELIQRVQGFLRSLDRGEFATESGA